MDRTIGIKVADGTFYAVLEDGFYGDKRLVLTTVRDNQSEVHIDLYQGPPARGISGGKYIGSLIIENIQAARKGEPDIELVIGASREGNLNVSATDRSTGEEQSLSVSLQSEEEGEFDIPDFEMEGSAAAEGAAGLPEAREEEAAGAEFPEPPPTRTRIWAVLFFVVAAFAVIAVVAYLVFRALQGPAAPALEAGAKAAATPAVSQAVEQRPPASSGQAAAVPAEPVKASQDAKAAEPAPPATPAAPAAPPEGERGVRYRVKWGDTLWDLSSTYYRDPWLYPRIAKANAIVNPDLILAGSTVFIPER